MSGAEVGARPTLSMVAATGSAARKPRFGCSMPFRLGISAMHGAFFSQSHPRACCSQLPISGVLLLLSATPSASGQQSLDFRGRRSFHRRQLASCLRQPSRPCGSSLGSSRPPVFGAQRGPAGIARWILCPALTHLSPPVARHPGSGGALATLVGSEPSPSASPVDAAPLPAG